MRDGHIYIFDLRAEGQLVIEMMLEYMYLANNRTNQL